jgi:hypothetical protein
MTSQSHVRAASRLYDHLRLRGNSLVAGLLDIASVAVFWFVHHFGDLDRNPLPV